MRFSQKLFYSWLVAIGILASIAADESSSSSLESCANTGNEKRQPATSTWSSSLARKWQEVFVHPNATKSPNVGMSLAQNLSVLMLHEFATPEEIMTLKQSAVNLYEEKSHEFGRTDTSTYMRGHGDDYLNLTSCWRCSVHSYLPLEAKKRATS